MAEQDLRDERVRQRLSVVIAHTRRAVISIALVSAVLNVLLLSGSIYMMLVYDYVLPSHSVPTMFGLAIIVLLAYAVQGVLDFVRGRLLIHFSAAVDVDLHRDVQSLVGLLSRMRVRGDALQPVRDLDQIRAFLSGPGPTALVDLPWILFFAGVLFLLHPYLGLTVLVGGAILIALTFLTERLTQARSKGLVELNGRRSQIAEISWRHAEALVANGMQSRVADSWVEASSRFLVAQERLAAISGGMSSLTRILRMVLQSAVLTVGALLVLDRSATAGVIFASSIISSRCLAPVEAAIANWRNFVGARQAWARIRGMIGMMPETTAHDILPPPSRSLRVERVVVAPPGTEQATVDGVTFGLNAGSAMAIIGPSGGGKSSLVRALIGFWPPLSGDIRLDGADLGQWTPDTLGKFIGYVPQNVELIQGTIAQNIARFDPDADAEDIIAAARNAGVHDLILQLPEGYGTQVGVDGSSLSGGQRQRIALARALYGDPFFIVLDEPNANLDAEGDEALAGAITQAKNRGAIVIAVAHRPSILNSVDMILVMKNGKAMAFGPKERIAPMVLGDRSRSGHAPRISAE